MSKTMKKICKKGTRENKAFKEVLYNAYCKNEDLTTDEILKRMGEYLKSYKS